MHAAHRFLALIVLALPCGCLRPDVATRFTPAWEALDASDPGWLRSRKVLLVSDCQVHNLYSQALPERNLSAEAAAATAIRPPQLDLFAADVLRWIVTEGAQDADLVLHLGDALDLACEGEFEGFLEVMAAAGRPWLMAPGNHDFFYFGTYDPQDVELWQMACHGSGAVVSKDRFIRRYVAALLQQDDPGFAALAAALGVEAQRRGPVEELMARLPDAFEWHAEDGAPGLLAGIAWEIVRAEPWRSYIVQSVDVSSPDGGLLRTRALLLDSCQYGRRPELIPNAWQSYPVGLNCGFTGEMLPNQLRTARRWLEASPEGTSFTAMFHHPFESLAPRARASLAWLWRERRINMLVTGHTHTGFFAHHDIGGEFDELELNLGSTTDWPMEWRTLVGCAHPERKLLYLQVERFTFAEELRRRGGYFEPGWEVPVDAPDDYRKYKQGRSAGGLLFDFYLAHHLTPYWLPQPHIRPNAAARETENSVKDTLLWTYLRLLREFPTDARDAAPRWPSRCASDREVSDRILTLVGQAGVMDAKIELLRELEAFERSRKSRDRETGEPNDAVRTRFKLSQAAWASRFESSRGRRLSVEDELVRVDWRKAMERRRSRS